MLLIKAHIKGYTRRLKSGVVSQVREHEDARQNRPKAEKPKALPTWKMTLEQWKAHKRTIKKEGLGAAIRERERQTEVAAKRALSSKWQDFPQIVKRLGIVEARVGGALQRLKEAGIIEIIEADFQPGGLVPSRYRLTPIVPGMIRVTATNVAGLKQAASKYSTQHPEMYVMAVTIFNEAYLSAAPRLTVKAPNDTRLGGYWKAGQFKPFSEKQIKAEQRTWENAGDR